MSFKPEHIHFTSVNPHSLHNHVLISQRPSSKINSNFNYTKSNYTDFDKSINAKEKEWFNTIKNNQIELVNSSIGKTIEKPKTASLEDQRKNNLSQNIIKE